MARTRTSTVRYSSRELSYIRMHQLKKIEKRKKIIEEVKLFLSVMLLCALFIFGLDSARTLFQRGLEESREPAEVGSVMRTDSSDTSIVTVSYCFKTDRCITEEDFIDSEEHLEKTGEGTTFSFPGAFLSKNL